MATMIFEQQTLTGFTFDENYNVYTNGFLTPAPFILVDGESYNVRWYEASLGEQTFSCTAYSFELNGVTTIALGNKRGIGGEDTGEPFFVIYSEYNDGVQFFSDTGADATVTIYQNEANDVILKNYHGMPQTYEGVNYVALRNALGNTTTFVSEHLVQNQVQADWAQTDETAVDYIKNKPFGVASAVMENRELEFSTWTDQDGGYVEFEPIELILGETYKVICDGTEYTYECKDGATYDFPMYYLGDLLSHNPILIVVDYDKTFTRIETTISGTTHIISIIPVNQTQKLDEKYIPNIFVKSVNGKTPDVNGNVQISAGGGSGQTGTIEKDVTIEWDTSVTPTITFDITGLGLTAYKIADVIPTKEQLLSAKWQLSDYLGENVYNVVLVENEITEYNEVIFFQFSTSPNFAYAISYSAGETAIDLESGSKLIVNVPETGLYQFWDTDTDLPTTIFGSLTYTEVEEVDFVQSDWSQTDYTQPDYIKHRPFGDIEVSETLIDGNYNYVYTVDDGWMPETIIPITSDMHLTEGNTYEVTFNGTKYICEAFSYAGIAVVGNTVLIGGEDNGVPFAIAEDVTGTILGAVGFMFTLIQNPDPTISTSVSYDIKLVYSGMSTKKIDTKYLYQPNWDENDKSNGSYIANKPFGTLISGITAVDTSVTMMTENENAYVAFGFPIEKSNFVDGGKYNVTFNGNTYENCTCVFDTSANAYVITEPNGNIGIADSHPDLNGMSFITAFSETSLDGVACDLKVVLAEDYIKKIDSKYLPDDIGGGSGLPEITPDTDEGKFLRVIGGVAAWSTVPNAEEVSF